MTSIGELFEAAGVQHLGVVPWGTDVPLDDPGVYVVGLTADLRDAAGLAECPIDDERVSELLRVRPEATVDGTSATLDSVADGLRRMWLPDEPTVYIGLAGGSVRSRTRQFYGTAIGARAPHAGGWPVKMLDQSVAPLWVHFAAAADPDATEAALVAAFVSGVAPSSVGAVFDVNAPLPFANLMFPRGRRKRHGFAGVKSPRQSRKNAPPSL